MNSTNVQKAVLLAAGKGTRMRELTNDLPKPMIAVRGKPILQHIVEGLEAAGVTHFLTPVTILYNDRVVEVTRTLADPDDLWVVPEDLARISGFALRGNQICLDRVCVSARPDSDLRIVRSSQTWVSMTS